jgi:glycosyltransferase involved in cell wall biosynthesis
MEQFSFDSRRQSWYQRGGISSAPLSQQCCSMTIRTLCVTSHSDRPETETFIGLHQAQIDIEVFCPPEAPHRHRLIEAGVPVHDFVLNGRFDQQGIATLRRRLKEKKPHILHLFNNKAASNGIRAAKGLPVKIICYRGIVGNINFYNPMSWMTYLHPRVDRIVCVAEAVRRYILSMNLFGVRVPERKVVTIYKGHDLSWYDAQPADLKHAFNIPDNAFVVGCVANLRPRKGIEVLIEATHHLPANANIHLLLVGHMESRSLQHRIAASPLCDTIHLTGFRRDAPSLIAACHLSVLASLRREGLPKTVIESMAYGVPPIVTDSGGSPELVVESESGLIIPPGDPRALARAITQLMEDEQLRRSCGRKARQRIADHFNIQTTIEQTHSLYESIQREVSA